MKVIQDNMENNLKQNNSLIILLSILLFISLVIAGFFAYQTQKLAKQLSESRNQNLATQTPISTSDPIADLSRAESKDWKTYADIDGQFQFKFPANFQIKEYKSWFFDAIKLNDNDQTIFDFVKITETYVGSEKYINDVYNTEIENKLDAESISPIKTVTISGKKGFYYEKKLTNTKHIYIDVNETLILKIDIEMESDVFDQILSTFKFLDDTSEATKVPLKTLKYNLPQGWSAVKYYDNTFEIGYDPSFYETKVSDARNDKNSLWIVKKNSMTPYSNSFIFSLLPYDGGSRHKFIYNQIGETPTGGDLYRDYKELEYNISGKSCLILDGISISQYPVVWAMCAVGDKAILMTTFDRNNYLSILQTLKIN